MATPQKPTSSRKQKSKTTPTTVVLDRYLQESSFDEPTFYGRLIHHQSNASNTSGYVLSTSQKLAEFDYVFNRRT
ncbi:hypothetical protein QBC43DRAFT_293992 [Cladorrhinum sp. PSN259]|nr:hypothetical protein QBC43DRAFT_293992 [Cladorrhinum sp. PSN259]